MLSLCLCALVAVLAGCGPKRLPAAAAVNGFHSGSAVHEAAPGLYTIGVEAILTGTGTPGLAEDDFHFELPAGGAVERIEGTLSYRGDCFSQALGVFVIGGHPYATILKLPRGGGAANIFVRYMGPLPTGDGHARIHVEADPAEAGCLTTWEFQGLLEVN